jgi:hypothetical protein
MMHWVHVCACLVLTASMAAAAQSSVVPGGSLRIDKLDDPTPNNQPPDANAQMQMHDRQTKQQTYAEANAERRKHIAENTAKLLKLATELQAEIEKTTKDTLSLNVIRKADEIERLATSVKELMKISVGPS